MPSPWQSGLAKLDDSLQPFQSQLDRLQAGLEVSEAELFHSLEEAQQNAAAVRDLILAERPDVSWSDRGSLEHVIEQLEAAELERANQQRRNKLLELASEPEANEWLLWAAGLEEERDASIVTYLRHDYPLLERFAGELDDRYWKPAIRSESPAKASAEQTTETPAQADAKPAQVAVATNTTSPEPTVAAPASTQAAVLASAQAANPAPAMSETQVHSTVNMLKVPSRPRSRKAAEALKVEPEVVESVTEEPPAVEPEVVEASPDSAEETEKMPSFGVLSQAKRPAAIWVAAAAGVILLSATFAGIYRSSAKASNTPGGAASPKADVSTPAAVPPQPVAKQAVEGTQRQTALDLERCQRMSPGNIQCWGYVSNVGTDLARVSLQSVDVVDGKGNTFNLRGIGQLDFTTGRSSNISAGDRAKYTVTVPDKDPNANTLTLYVDVTNPHALEYTFRDIPIT